MDAKTLTIQIKLTGEALERFPEIFKAVEAGHRVRRREAVYLTSIGAVRNLLALLTSSRPSAVSSRDGLTIYELGSGTRI